jgi:hypothetical protein
MSLSNAFEITSEDIVQVLNHMGHQCDEQKAEVLFRKLDKARAAYAALSGEDLDEQTNFAYRNICDQVEDLGFRNMTDYNPFPQTIPQI